MKFLTYAESINDLNQIKNAGLCEVIISNSRFSRLAKNKEAQELLQQAKEMGMVTVFEWDILNTQLEFEQTVAAFEKLNHDFIDKIRVQDPGVLEYVLENTKKPIQFIAETGNHNLTGLQKWCDYIGERLDRLVISIELNKDTLKEYSERLDADIEILAAGRILLFYSPRKLLSNLLPSEDEASFKNTTSLDYIEALGESEESPHKGFPLTENRHGTFMFHIKNLFLLDRFAELQATGINFLRVDFRDLPDRSLLSFLTNRVEELKEHYPLETIRGYFQINKSDVLFKKLKNYRIQRKDESYLGEVIETVKGDYMAIQLKAKLSLALNTELKIITPEGKDYYCKVHKLLDTSYSAMDSIPAGTIALMNYMGGVWPKSQVYLK